MSTTHRTEEESDDKPDTVTVKGNQDYQDAEGRMGEKPHAPRINPETPEFSDPKQPDFELDSSEVLIPVKTPKPTRNTRIDGLQRKVNGLEKNYNDLNTNYTSLETQITELNNNFALLLARLPPQPTTKIEDVTSKIEDVTSKIEDVTSPPAPTTYAPRESTTDTTSKEPVADAKTKIEDVASKIEDVTSPPAPVTYSPKEPTDDTKPKSKCVTIYVPESSTTVATFKEPADDVKSKSTSYYLRP